MKVGERCSGSNVPQEPEPCMVRCAVCGRLLAPWFARGRSYVGPHKAKVK